MICTDNSGYDGHFSIIYNNSCNNFNLITDFSFTQNPRSSTNQEGIEDEVINLNKTKNITHIETANKEIIMETSDLIYDYSYKNIFSDINDGIISDSDIKTEVKDIEVVKETTNKTKEDIINNIEEIMKGEELGNKRK